MPRVLIVDDSPSLRVLYRHLLANHGYDVLLASDGPEALEVARAQLPQLIVLDIVLPTLSGFQVCEALRAQPATASIKILMLTGRWDEDSAERCRAAGADECLMKDSDAMAVVAAADRLLGLR